MEEFDVVVTQELSGGFSVYVPKLPGCVSQGETKSKALSNIGEAIQLYVDDMSAQEFESIRQKVAVVKTKVTVNA